MTGRWARATTILGITGIPLAWALGCAGGSEDGGDAAGEQGGAADPGAPDGGGGRPRAAVGVPAELAHLVPEGVRASRVESGTDPRVVHLTVKSLEPIRAWWTDRAGVAVTGHGEDRLVGAWWEGDRVRFAIAEVPSGAEGVALRVYDSVPDVPTTGPDCAPGQRPVTAGWPDGGVLSTCVLENGVGRPVGPFRVERYGVRVIEGAFDDQSQRTGVWTVRNDAGDVAATGAFEAGVPIGGWMFSLGGVEHQVLYVDGAPQDLPFARLPTEGRDPRPWAEARLEVLDADLEAGVVAAAVRFQLAPDPATGAAPRDCPALGRVDPREGLVMQVLKAGHREPLAEWTIYDATPAGGECTTEAAAAEALAAANAAFSARGLDPARRPALVAPAAGTDPFAEEGVRLEVDGHTIELRGVHAPLTLEAQLLSPDLLAGSWVESDRQRVRTAEVAIDGQPLEEIRMRWPSDCEGGASVVGAIAEPPWAAVVYQSNACSGGGPLWSIGPPLRLGVPGPGDVPR